MRVRKEPKQITLVCVVCGKEYVALARNSLYCSEECRNESKKMRVREYAKENYTAPKKRIQRRPKLSINQVMRELEEYNTKNKTRLTYGQYVAIMGGN